MAGLATPASAGPDFLDFFDLLLWRYTRPKAAAGSDALHLLFLVKVQQESVGETHRFRCTPDDGWSEVDTYRDGHTAVAFLDGALYIFRSDNYSVYHGDKWRPAAWPHDWPPAAACRVGKAVWVFGPLSEEDTHQIAAARIVPPEGDEADAGPTPLGEPLELSARAYDLRVVARDGKATVFWHQDAAEDLVNEVWHSTFDGTRWTPPQQVPMPYAYSAFTAAGHDGKVWLFARARGRRITEKHPLRVLTWTNGSWNEADPPEVPNARDPWLAWTLDIEAISFGGDLYLFRTCMSRVVAHRWADGQWHEEEVVTAIPPWPTYLFWWGVANVVACLGLLPLVAWCALRARGRTRCAVFPSGLQLTVAKWPRRVAAVLVDFLLTWVIGGAVIAIFLGGGDDAASQLAMLPTMLGLQLGIFFAYFVVGEGLAGQSLGKRLLGIAVISRQGARPSLRSVVIRNLFRPWLLLFPFAYLVGSVFVLATPASQRLGDIAARTLVVEVPRERRRQQPGSSSPRRS